MLIRSLLRLCAIATLTFFFFIPSHVIAHEHPSLIAQRMDQYDRSCKKAGKIANRLRGRILIQTESRGETWYVHPTTCERHRLANPEDVVNLVRAQAKGIRTVDLLKIPPGVDYKNGQPFGVLLTHISDRDTDGIPDAYEQAFGTNPDAVDTDKDGYDDLLELFNQYHPAAGKSKRLPINKAFINKNLGVFFTQVQNKGEAWYVNPKDGKRYFLGSTQTNLDVLVSMATGIRDKDLAQILESRHLYGLPVQNNETIPFKLTLPAEYQIELFAKNLRAPRVMAFAPDGTMLVTDLVDRKVIALPDKNNDSRADANIVVLDNLLFPNGLAFYEGRLYVAQEDGVYRYDYDPKTYRATGGAKIVPLPTGGEHRTRSIAFGPDKKLYISIGSSCNACIEKDERNATIMRSDPDGSLLETYAIGLRNTVFFAFDYMGRLWGNDMGRDLLGDDTPPDEVNIIQQGKDYGWPYCYGKNIRDNSIGTDEVCDTRLSSVHDYKAHVAPLGMVFVDSAQFPAAWQGDLIVAFHGSWNHQDPRGYTVVRLDVENDMIVGEEEFITGWKRHIPGENPAKTAYGRPTGVVFGADGALYISDDKSGLIYRVSKK